jgi:hypothetical protein
MGDDLYNLLLYLFHLNLTDFHKEGKRKNSQQEEST